MTDTQNTKPAMKASTFGSESGHWYDKDANLIEKVLKANGQDYTKPTLRHARKLGLVPGVTSIIKMMHAEQLVRWRINQHVLAALTLDRQEDETDASYLARVAEDANTHGREAAEEGTRIHAAIEQFMRGESYSRTYEPHVAAVTTLLAEHCGADASWLPERGVVHRWGYATKADCVSERNGWLVDFKGCDGDAVALDTKRTFESHHMQLAATRNCIAPELRCAIVYVSRDNPGAVSFVEVTEKELVKGLGMFRGLLHVWQQSKGHCPDWAEGAF